MKEKELKYYSVVTFMTKKGNIYSDEIRHRLKYTTKTLYNELKIYLNTRLLNNEEVATITNILTFLNK